MRWRIKAIQNVKENSSVERARASLSPGVERVSLSLVVESLSPKVDPIVERARISRGVRVEARTSRDVVRARVSQGVARVSQGAEKASLEAESSSL